MNIKVRNIPKEDRKGTTKLENLPEFCITLYGAEREDREEFMRILDGLGVRWPSGIRPFESEWSQEVLNGTHWLFFDLLTGVSLVGRCLGARRTLSTQNTA